TLFATEHEAGTYDFQRSLPVSAGRLFFAKVTFAVASTAAILGLLWCLAAAWAGFRFPSDPVTHRQIWAAFGFGAVELLIWGTFFSLLLHRPLKATVLGVTAAAVSVHFLVAESGPQYFRAPYLDALPRRAVFAAMVAVPTVWLGLRWFRERVSPSAGLGRLGLGERGVEEAAGPACADVPTQGGILGRLLWQHLWQSAGMLSVVSAMVLPAFVIGIDLCIWKATGGLGRPLNPQQGFSFVAATWLALGAVPLAGACVFLGDQRRHGFRFLTERGVSPRTVWVSRHLIWIVPVLAWTVLVSLPYALGLGLELLGAPRQIPPEIQAAEARFMAGFVGGVLGFVILAYAAGQLTSMLFSSGILAGVVGVALAVFLSFWSGLMLFLGVPWLWSVVPIPLVLLLATWLRTPHWLLERNTLKAWLPTALALALPAVVIVASVCAYRVYSVPVVDLGFDPEQFGKPATAEARATADMYRRAVDLYVPMQVPEYEEGEAREPLWAEPGKPLPEAEIAWFKENEESLRLTLEATEKSACDFFDPTRKTFSDGKRPGMDALGFLLIRSARRFESEGNLDAAFERYLAILRFSAHLRRRTATPSYADLTELRVYESLPDWATHADQTAERIRAAIEKLEPLQKDLSSPSDAIKSDYIRLERILAGDLDPTEFADFEHHPKYGTVLVMQWLPWEKARTERVLNMVTAEDLKAFAQVESAVLGNQRFTLPDEPRSSIPVWGSPERTTPWINLFHNRQARWRAIGFVAAETRRRAVRLQLALAAWHLEHGKLPEGLEELVGPFLNELPLDPYTAGPFQYSPEPTPVAIRDLDPWGQATSREPIVPAGKPFFRSAGADRRLRSGSFECPGFYHSTRDFVFPIPIRE
ncbi:MAG: hypothetical protein ABIP48_33440, partial [Planctomycetota bacterium]